LKIVHVVRQFSPSVGGLESAVLSLAQHQMRDLGCDARVVTLNRLFGQIGILPGMDKVGGVPVTRLPWRGSPRYPIAPGVLGQVRDADIVHVHAIDFFFDFLALTWPLHRRRLIASTHGGFFHTATFATLKRLWFNTVTKASARAYAQIVACSQSDHELFRDHVGQRLTLVENGIDHEKFSGAASERQTRTIIYFGRLTAHKQVQALFPVLAALRRRHPAWRLIVAGRQWGQSIAELRALAAQSDVADGVTFENEPSDERLRQLVGTASFFACLSRYEGFGLAAVEAMSAGLVPLLSDIAPFRALRDKAPDALIMGAGAVEDAGARIEALVIDDAEHAARKLRLVNAARRFDWAHVARQYAKIYEDALDRRPAATPLKLGSRV
jgi:alpha-1,3-mannosyltransferase